MEEARHIYNCSFLSQDPWDTVHTVTRRYPLPSGTPTRHKEQYVQTSRSCKSMYKATCSSQAAVALQLQVAVEVLVLSLRPDTDQVGEGDQPELIDLACRHPAGLQG
jgi:hypothetical protein